MRYITIDEEEPATNSLETLETHLKAHGAVTLNQALDIALRILTILDYCHGRNMTHNNISPSKVIVSNGAPTLIDFSFPINGNNKNGSAKDLKDFIDLPENSLSLDSMERSSQVVDLTAVAGIVFYILTDMFPGSLKDEDGRMPHQRLDARQKLEEKAGFRNFLLNQIFDKAFQCNQENRYQNASEFKEDLLKLKNYKPSTLPAKNLNEIVNSLRSDNQSQTVTPTVLRLETALSGIKRICAEIVGSLEEEFRELSAGFKKELASPVYTAHLKFNYNLNDSGELNLEFRIEIVGSEIVVLGKAKSRNLESVEELFRQDHLSFTDSKELEEPVLEFVASTMASFLNDVVD